MCIRDRLLTVDSVKLENQPKAFVEVYSNDLNNDLLIELKHFVPRVKLQERDFFLNRSNEDHSFHDTTVCPFKVLNWIIDCKMIDVFPRIYTCLLYTSRCV